jgi:cell division protein FtsI/penicillin-binding protein 2
MAAHILGFTGKNYKGESQGYFGVEGFYDEQLRGRDGILKREADVLGNPIILGKNEEISAEDGRDLYLTIDKTVQYIVESKLKEGMERYQALGGTVIVYEPATGAILACASFPSYNPAKFEEYPSGVYANPAIASSYEPGSTFKVLVMAAALNEEKIKPDAKYDETGSLEIGGYTIKTWNDKYHGKISISQILEYSSNVGMVFVGNNLGEDMLVKYIENLGFGSKTDIDLQEESSPDIRPRNKWYKIDYATASFGQGIAVTPLQMIRAVSAIANEGKLMKPYVVKSIKLIKGKVITTKPQVEKQIFKREVAAFVSELMAEAVENGETRNLRPIGYRIAGKTGTAQVPIAGHYDTEKTIASFVGFAPVDKPKFVMLVALREPSASIWGSETAAPIFFEIAKELFSYYRISPS